MRRSWLVARCVCLFVLLSLSGLAGPAGSAFAQTGNGSISGTVQDPTKALIPGVSVTATNVDTNVQQTQVTNESGSYSFPVLPPGTYKITGDLPGFRKEVVDQIRLPYAGQVRIDLTLQVGQSTEVVDVVVGTDSILRESSSSVTDVLTQERIENLPMVGNNVLNLLDTLPGLRLSPVGDAFNTIGGLYMDTLNATRDGMTTVDARFDYQTYGRNVLSPTTLVPDLVGEVRLVLSPADAEFGRGNAQMQISTRSGTNRYNGTATWNVRNSALDANTWANNHTLQANGTATPLPWRNNHEFTAAYGGPVRFPGYNGKNKTFFYGLYDGNISNTRDQVNANVLTDTARQGIIRYWQGYNPVGWNPTSTIANPTFPLTATTATWIAVDQKGNPVAPPYDPASTATNKIPYSGKLMCFSVFGNQRLDTNSFALVPFTQADCQGGTAVFGSNASGGTIWDTNRKTLDSSGLIGKMMTDMPHANYWGANDGLNVAQYRWTRGRVGSNDVGAEVGTDAYINRKQFNIKIDHNFNAKHKIAASYSYQRDDSGYNAPNWPTGVYGFAYRRPHVLTINFTSTLSSRMINEARFGMSRNWDQTVPAWFNLDPAAKKAGESFLLPAGQSTLNTSYKYLAVVGTGVGNVGDVSGPMSTTSGIDFQALSPLYNYADTLSWSKGKHTFKGGAEIRLPRSAGNGSTQPYPTVALGNNAGAATTLAPFSTVTNLTTELPGFLNATPTGSGLTAPRATAANLLYFLNGSVNNATQQYWINNATNLTSGKWDDYSTSGERLRRQVDTEWAAFVKDDFKITRRLTLNLGLRWEFRSAPYIDSGLTAAVLGYGFGSFGPTRGAQGSLTDFMKNPFAYWLHPGNLYLTNYGSLAGSAGAAPLSCQNGVKQNALLPTSNCDPSLLSTIQFVGPKSPNPNTTSEPVNYHDIGPAVGFAYQLPWFGAGKTTIRAGFQRTFGVAGRNGSSIGGTEAEIANAPGATNTAVTSISDSVYANIISQRALTLSDIQTIVPVRPTLTPGKATPIFASAAGAIAPVVYDPNFKTPYTDNINFSITRQLTTRMTLDLRYIGTFARKQQGTINLDTNNIYHNPEMLQALTDARAGTCTASAYTNYIAQGINPCDPAGDPVILDQMLAGLNINTGATGTDASGVTRTFGAVGTVVNGLFMSGAQQMRRSSTFQNNLSYGDFNSVTTSLIGLAPTAAQGRQAAPIDPSTGQTLAGVGQIAVRNGCDRIGNGFTIVQQTTANGAQVAGSGSPIPLRCFPEDYLTTNPQFSSVTYNSNYGHTNYNSLQVSLTARPINGVQSQINWTWAGSMFLCVSGLCNGGSQYRDPSNRNIDFTRQNIGAQSLRWNGTFELPIGPNKLLFSNASGWMARALEKWQTSMIFNASSGTPTSLTPGQSHLYSSAGYNVASAKWVNPKPDLKWYGNTGSIYATSASTTNNIVTPYLGVPDPQCSNPAYVTQGDKMGTNLGINPVAGGTSVCTIQALAARNPDGTQGEYLLVYSDPGKTGNLGYNTIKYFGQWTLDASASKSFKIGETKTFQLRVDATDVLNHPVPGLPSLNAGGPLGSVTTKSGGRQFQGQIRMNF